MIWNELQERKKKKWVALLVCDFVHWENRLSFQNAIFSNLACNKHDISCYIRSKNFKKVLTTLNLRTYNLLNANLSNGIALNNKEKMKI